MLQTKAFIAFLKASAMYGNIHHPRAPTKYRTRNPPSANAHPVAG